jgi:hypothetical protein
MHHCGRCRIPSSHRGYWLKKVERNAVRDKRVQCALRNAGWRVLVIWKCQTRRPGLRIGWAGGGGVLIPTDVGAAKGPLQCEEWPFGH